MQIADWTVAIPLVFDSRIDHPLSRISFSRGTTEPSFEQRNAYLYDEAALIPSLPYLGADARDFTCHRVSTSATPDYKSSYIGIFDLSHEARDLLEFNLHSLGSEMQVRTATRFPAFRAALSTFSVALEKRFQVQNDLELLGVSTKPPGLPTATFNKTSGFRPGMHVDSWDSSDSSVLGRSGRGLGRAEARNRIAINLGAEPRSFIFLNAALSRLAANMGIDPTDDVSVERLGREALRMSPTDRLTRISIKRGEAYIAPTENLLHDATTLERDRIDISLTFLASFFLPNESLCILQHPDAAAT